MSYPAIPINAIVSKYKEAFDWLHSGTSRQIIVMVEPLRSGCLNHSGWDPILKKAFPVYNSGNPFSQTSPTVIPSFNISGTLNIPFSGGVECPVCNGNGFLLSPSSGIINARIQWRNQDTDFDVEKAKLKSDEFSVRIKVTGSVDAALVDRNTRVIIDGRSCLMVKQGVPVGLRDIHSYYYYFKDLQ